MSTAADLSTLAPAVRNSSLEIGQAIVVDRVELNEGETVALELERFAVWAPDARIEVHGDGDSQFVAPPETIYLRGRIAGVVASRATLSVDALGRTRGLLNTGGRYWIVGERDATAAAGNVVVREIDPEAELGSGQHEFSCGATALDRRSAVDAFFGERDPAGELLQEFTATAQRGSVTNTARVALETDFEFWNKFGNTPDAMAYAGDLIAYVSTVYADEIQTDLQVESLDLWSTSSDPWNQSGTTCGLMEFGDYWNANNGGIDRSLAHFLSGKNNGGGVAWVGVLCSDPFGVTLSDFGLSCSGLADTGNYGGDYGYSGDLDANFDIDNPSVLWDVVVVAHEIGHNFNSPHTHCYSGLGGNSDPVDECYSGQCGQSGCYCGATSLPCGTTGAGCGTIMSYCHLRGGGISNISMTFGTGHPFGVAPGRVPARMRDEVDSVDAACVAPVVLDEIFANAFEGGNTDAWSSTT